MNRRSCVYLRVVFAFVVVILATIVTSLVRVVFHFASDRLAGLTFLVAVACLVLVFERIFPSVYSDLKGRSNPWWQTRAGVFVGFLVIGTIVSILSSRIATMWFALVIIAGVLIALVIRAMRGYEEL